MKKNINIWIMVGGAVLLLSIMMTLLSNYKTADNLPVYTGGDEVPEGVTESKKEKDIPTNIYVDNVNQFSMEIPSEWQEVEQDGYETFIHTPSGASVQIRIGEYEPTYNNASAETCAASLEQNVYVFKNFTWTSNTSYQLLYQDYKESTFDYIEDVHWDRDTVIVLLCIFKDAHYSKLQSYYDKILTSFVWEQDNPVPDGWMLYYDEPRLYEIGIPDTWAFANTGDAFCAYDEQTDAQIIITAQEYNGDLSGLTPSSLIDAVSSGRENYMINNYDIQSDYAKAYATYTSGDIQYQSIDVLTCNGQVLYNISCTYENGRIDASTFDTCISLFRTFL